MYRKLECVIQVQMYMKENFMFCFIVAVKTIMPLFGFRVQKHYFYFHI